MNTIEYTFIVSTYNQQDVVVQALESIKFQIQAYADEKTVQLIIGDDASCDNTIKVIDAWLAENYSLFALVNKFYFKENQGTCRNYVNSMRNIKGKYFREMAGDDILPVNNIFEIMERTEKDDVITAIILPFSNGIIKKEKDEYKNILRQALWSSRELKFYTQLSCPILNGAIWKRDLMTNEILEYISRYRLIEDRPQWYKIFRDNKDINYHFEEKAVLLYRKETGSVTTSTSVVRDIYEKDMHEIYHDIYENAKAWYVKLCIKSMKRWKFLNPVAISMKIKDIKYKKKVDEIWNKILEEQIVPNQQYLTDIIEKSEQFIKKLEFKGE